MNRSLLFLRDAACAAACALTGSAALAVSPAGMSLPFAGEPGAAALPVVAVDDDVLARQTGKFADATMISGVVVNLLSQWQLPNGALAVAQGTLNIVANAANQLSAQVQTLASVVGGDNAGPTGAQPGNGASGGQSIRVNGVSQVTQVAGNGNAGNNGMSIDFGSNGKLLTMLAGASNAPSASASNADGSIRAAISFGANGVTLALNTPAGLATQTIAPAAAAQAGSIAQLLQITGNQQVVSNQLQLQLRTQQMSAGALRQAGVLQALQAAFPVRK
ncbi:peptidase C39 [Burkholderia gladioli]|uniref:peptidase C39 n=1 Tax=Burkholderia gladioli TaxID=28095 RepID=UPI00163FA571|nr:peptidase C39 [Burkholderia gladioli]MDN7499459.1 peptidase C39 [Burkholderia gladioli]